MDGMRARDADRDRFVELIEAAYVDGQLGDADRELRVSRALSAETLDELQTLTRDLQRPAGFVPTPVAARAPARERLGSALLVAIAAVVVAGGVGMVALVGLAVGPTSESSGSSGSAIVSEEAVPVDEPAVPSFEMTPAEVRGFLRAYEAEFGTLDVYEAGFYPARVGVKVPVRGSRPRFERWSWDGGWRQDTEAAVLRPPSPVVDLGAIDVRRLFANIAVAMKTLGVQRGELSHVLVNTWTDGRPTVNIYVSNSFGESGYLKTTMSGEVVRSLPYDG